MNTYSIASNTKCVIGTHTPNQYKKFKATPLILALLSAIYFCPISSFANDDSQVATTLTAEPSQEALTSQQNVEVITVTSGFRQQNLQKTANSLSVISVNEIKQRNAQNLEEVIALAPNVNFASGSQRARYYQIRGIGERSQFQEPINPSVGLIIDDIDFTGIGSIASMFDVAQTEIYRGPQGTRFGANAMAGIINIVTNEPTDEFEGAIKLNAGNYNSFGAGLMLSGSATESTNYRVAIEQYQSDGFINNRYLKTSDTNNRDELTARIKLAIKASDDLTIDIALLHVDFDNGYDAFSLDNTRETLSDNPGFDSQKTSALSSKFSYSKFSTFNLISIFSYANSDLGYGYDEDWSNDTLCQVNDCPYGDYSSTDYYFRSKKTATAELRLVSKAGHELFNGTTSWVTGLYYKKDSELLTRQYTYLSNDYSSRFDTQSVAAFAQFDTSINKQLTLTMGLRLEQRNADYSNSDVLNFSPNDDMLGGKLLLSYQHDENQLFYGSINRGYKAGGVNTSGSLPDSLRAFNPEFVWNYELGYKVSLLNNSAYLRVAAFYMDRDDMQVSASLTTVRDDGSSAFISYLDNAAAGVNKGIELDGSWQVTDNIELVGSLGLLDTEFTHYINSEGVDLIGREQAHAPNYQFSVGINYQFTEQWLANVSIDGKDSFYFSDSHDEKSKDVQLVNASLSYQLDTWQVQLWARNILNEDYKTRGFFFGNDPRDGYTAKGYQQFGEPMVFGVSVDYQF